jgi:hypothetical protein
MSDHPCDHGMTEGDEPTVLKSWTSPFGIENDKRKAELVAMPGFTLNVDLAMLGRSGHVMYRNAEELARHADQFMRSRRPFAHDANDQIEEFEKELVRFLHNYLTSVYSLIESQRVVMRHSWGDQSEFETGAYTEHRKASFETGEAEFMTELRNYCTHRSVPVPHVSSTLTGGAGRPSLIINRLTLDRDELLKWKKWTVPAKEYLRAKEERFDLGPVIQSYVNTAAAFFNWFVSEINERNAEIKDAYMKAAEAYAKWHEDQMGMNTEGYRKLFGPPPSERNRSQKSGQSGQRNQPKRTTKRQRRK